MGLDQFINVNGINNPSRPPTGDDAITNNPIEIWYGRKEWEIHKWMHDNFIYKGGDPSLPFNCESYVMLDEKDMDDLMEDIKSSDAFADVDKELLSDYWDMCYKVKKLVERGNTVYYTSWW